MSDSIPNNPAAAASISRGSTPVIPIESKFAAGPLDQNNSERHPASNQPTTGATGKTNVPTDQPMRGPNDMYALLTSAQSAIQSSEAYISTANSLHSQSDSISDGETTETVERSTCTPRMSVVMPCLNEADTLATCIEKAKQGLAELPVPGEIIIADNGSTDGSQEIARQLGVRIVDVPTRGYGAALMAGIAASRGEYVVMGDADDSYDFRDVPRFYAALESGADMAQGCRLPRGGGEVLPGAMPWLHRWLGNPMLTFLAVTMFRAPVNDVYCGLRGFRRDWQQSLSQRCTGMEFAVEMIVKGALFKSEFAEVPIKLHPDGRTSHAPHLRTFRDGWRTLRFFLLNSPKFTMLVPGVILCSLALIGILLALPGITIAGIAIGPHTLLVSMLGLIVGAQTIGCAIIAKVFASEANLLPRHSTLQRALHYWNLERRLLACGVSVATGVALIGLTAISWAMTGFGELNYATTMRNVIPGVGLIALGAQLAATSFVISVLRMAKK